ncbi:hypothetical protein [Streptomyces cinerochromogenes]|uniref:hypothetical protein n=1 Tax=Streptomyces cinerochromogenes TaxID=66422 RepID=UPI0033B7C33C
MTASPAHGILHRVPTGMQTLAAARAYYAEAGSLAAPVTATALDKPVGQWLANVPKDGGLGKDPERAARRAAQLAGIHPYWRPAWPVDP